MNIHIKAAWELRKCPECAQNLPPNWDWDVRSLKWMHDQPRNVSPTNNDLTIHDGHNRRNRFLHIEFKRDDREILTGQRREIEGLAMLDMFTVLIVRGKLVDRITVQHVNRLTWHTPVETTCEALNTAVASYLNGSLWRDAAVALASKARPANVPKGKPGHCCGYSEVRPGEFLCIQDFYAVGFDPESGCGDFIRLEEATA